MVPQGESKWTPLFWFDTSELPDSVDTEVLTSELRIYKEAVSPIDGYVVESLSKYGPGLAGEAMV